LQQNSDRLASDLGNQLALHRLFGHHANRPTGIPRRRSGADHRDDPLAQTVVQQGCRPRPLLIVQRSLQSALLIAAPDFTHRFGR